MTDIIYVKDKLEIEALGSALTLEGLAESSIDEYLDWIEEHTKLKTRKAYVIRGKLMNDLYKLTGDNAYPDSLTIVAVDLDDIEDVNKIVLPRFEINARWLDDIIENNLERER